MRHTSMVALLTLILSVSVFSARAEEDKKDKEVTLKGVITCAKCDLGLEKSCATVIKVSKKGEKDKVYYFDEKGHKKYHSNVCTSGKKGEVVGVTGKKKDKLIVKVKKVKYDKE